MTKKRDDENIGTCIASSITLGLNVDSSTGEIPEEALLSLTEQFGLSSAFAGALKEIKIRKAAGEIIWVTRDGDRLVVHGETSKWNGNSLNTYSGPPTYVVTPLSKAEIAAMEHELVLGT